MLQLRKKGQKPDMTTERQTGPSPGVDDGTLAEFVPQEMRHAVAQLAPLLYGDLKRLAHRERSRMFSPNTLTTTALVNEVFVRLSGNGGFESHAHFLRVAATAMRCVLIDRARAQLSQKRGGDLKRVELDDQIPDFQVEDSETVFAVHEALRKLAEFAPRLAQVVECRYFAGYTEPEIAEALGVNERTVQRDWVAAKAWLAKALGEAGMSSPV